MSETKTVATDSPASRHDRTDAAERPGWLSDRLLRLRGHAMGNPPRPSGFRGLAYLRAMAANRSAGSFSFSIAALTSAYKHSSPSS